MVRVCVRADGRVCVCGWTYVKEGRNDSFVRSLHTLLIRNEMLHPRSQIKFGDEPGPNSLVCRETRAMAPKSRAVATVAAIRKRVSLPWDAVWPPYRTMKIINRAPKTSTAALVRPIATTNNRAPVPPMPRVFLPPVSILIKLNATLLVVPGIYSREINGPSACKWNTSAIQKWPNSFVANNGDSPI